VSVMKRCFSQNLNLVVRLLFACFASAGMTSLAQQQPAGSRSFEGVTATFQIRNPILMQRQDLKVAVAYTNNTDKTIKFRFFGLDSDAKIFRKGQKEPVAGVGVSGEVPIREVTLKLGATVRLSDLVHLKEWPDLLPGDYEIRFFYHLGAWQDRALARKYQDKYPHDGLVVPWDENRYPFTVVANPDPPEPPFDLNSIPEATLKDAAGGQRPDTTPR
jgi:hypothetical protein